MTHSVKNKNIIVILFSVFSLLLGFHSYGQKKDIPKTAEVYLKLLNSSKDTLYHSILKEYDEFIAVNPNNTEIQIERCKIIEKAYYDSYDEYNPKYKEFEKCLSDLVKSFPKDLDVLLYNLNNLYGDTAIQVCKEIIAINVKNPGYWEDQKLALVYQRLAEQYSYNDKYQEAIKNGLIAQSLNDSIDMSLLLGSQYHAINNFTQAKKVLVSSLDSADGGYMNRQKGDLLVQLGLIEEALKAYQLVRLDTNAWIDEGAVAKAMIDNGLYEDARTFLVKDIEGSYNATNALHNLLAYDFQYSPVDSAFATYQKLMEEDFRHDVLGKYRLKLFFRAPFKGWSISDFYKVLYFVIFILIILIVPYIWILPIHFISQRFQIQSKQPSLKAAIWNLKDFWIISSGLLLIEFFSYIIFNYGVIISYFIDNYIVNEEANISLLQANSAIFFFLSLLAIISFLVKAEGLKFLKPGHWNVGKVFAYGFGGAILFRIVYFVLVKINIFPEVSTAMSGSIIDSLTSINTYYHPFFGFLITVIIVPIYEEFLFRGIILNAVEKRLQYVSATVIQSLVFAFMHDNWSLFLFYFGFSILVAHFVRKSNSLLTSIVFHATNNLIAFLALLAIS